MGRRRMSHFSVSWCFDGHDYLDRHRWAGNVVDISLAGLSDGRRRDYGSDKQGAPL